MKGRLATIVLVAIYLFGITLTSFTPRSEPDLLFISVFLAFVPWFFWLKENINVTILILTALIGRLVFFLELPLLSDDFYRFIWDGSLLLDGVNPIGKIPSQTDFIGPAAQELLDNMNSADYPSVYPPLHQLGMAIGAAFSGLLHQVNGIRLFILLMELGGALYFFRRDKRLFGLYALYLVNPLVIVEGLGNVHFEAALLPLVAVSVHQAGNSHVTGSGISLAMSILVKLNPLMFFPAFYRNERGIKIVATAAVLVVICFLPFWNGLMQVFEGFDLYFRKFEFNASLYYLVAEICTSILGYNPISAVGPMFGLTSLLLICLVAFLKIELSEKVLISYLIFFIFSTTVHPWYIIPLIWFSILTRRNALTIWSFSVFFSYTHYYDTLSPKYAWITVEYALLLIAIIYEYRRRPIQLFRG